MQKNEMTRIIDATYLPVYTSDDPITILDETNLDELRDSFKFACRHKFRSFCTYPFLIPMIQSTVCPITLSIVENFPAGSKNTIRKIIDIGDIREKARAASRFEIDWVLNPFCHRAIREIDLINESEVWKDINFKFILSIEDRTRPDVLTLIRKLNEFECTIKTSTGRESNKWTFKQKLDYVHWMRLQTKHPFKISGGIKMAEEIEQYKTAAGPDTIFGVSINTLKAWDL